MDTDMDPPTGSGYAASDAPGPSNLSLINQQRHLSSNDTVIMGKRSRLWFCLWCQLVKWSFYMPDTHFVNDHFWCSNFYVRSGQWSGPRDRRASPGVISQICGMISNAGYCNPWLIIWVNLNVFCLPQTDSILDDRLGLSAIQHSQNCRWNLFGGAEMQILNRLSIQNIVKWQ